MNFHEKVKIMVYQDSRFQTAAAKFELLSFSEYTIICNNETGSIINVPITIQFFLRHRT